MNAYVNRVLGAIGLFPIVIMFFGCASTEVQTLTSSKLDNFMLTIANTEITQAEQQSLPALLPVKPHKTSSGEWEFIGEIRLASWEPKEGNSFIIMELKLLKRPTRKLAVHPNMLALVEPNTTNRWQGRLWIPRERLLIPRIKIGILDATMGAWSPGGSTLTLSSDGIGFSYVIGFSYQLPALTEPVSEQENKKTELVPVAAAGQFEFKGLLPNDSLRLIFEVPSVAAQKSLTLKLLERAIGEVRITK